MKYSDRFSAPLHHYTENCPCFTWSCIQWKFMSMAFDHFCLIVWFIIPSAQLLSIWIVVGGWGCPMSSSVCWIGMEYCAFTKPCRSQLLLPRPLHLTVCCILCVLGHSLVVVVCPWWEFFRGFCIFLIYQQSKRMNMY